MSKLWQGLEEMLGPAGVPAAWQSWMGPEFGVFRSAFLQRSARPAKSVPCPRDCGCAHRVVEHPDGSLVGVCDCDPWNCDDIPLQAEDVVILQLNPAKLGGAIAKAFSCERRLADFGLPNTWQVAAYSADAVPVILTIQNEEVSFRRVVAELTARLRKQFFLFAPTNRFMAGPSSELLQNVQAVFFDLESHFTLLPSGILQAHLSGGDLFSRHLPANEAAVRKTDALRVFGILTKLRSEPGHRKAPLATVFELTVLEQLSQKEAAKRCRPRCAPSLICSRVKTLEARFEMSIEQLRNLASDLRELDSTVKGDRLRKKKSGAPEGEGGADPDVDQADGAPGEVYVFDGGENGP